MIRTGVPLTTKELIELLLQQPQDAIIVTEGCDCYGDVGHVSYNEPTNELSLERAT